MNPPHTPPAGAIAPLSRLDGIAGARRHFRYFDYILAAFVGILLLSNLIGAAKTAEIGGYKFGAGHNAGYVCQATYISVFGSTARIVAASVIAFWVGEFVNSYVLARMKLWTGGRHLWSRTIGSTIFGQAADSLLFYPLAFYGVWPTENVVQVLVTNWALKVLWEIVLTPATYAAVGFLKRREGVDVYDEGTEFSPFAKAPSV